MNKGLMIYSLIEPIIMEKDLINHPIHFFITRLNNVDKSYTLIKIKL